MDAETVNELGLVDDDDPQALRYAAREGQPFITDGGHYILDCAFGGIDDPGHLQRELDGMIGVVEHGLFLGMASRVIVGGSQDVHVLQST